MKLKFIININFDKITLGSLFFYFTYTMEPATPTPKPISIEKESEESKTDEFLVRTKRVWNFDLDKARQELLELHNKARAEHGVHPLQLDPELDKQAQRWADFLRDNNLGCPHSHTKGLGENTAYRKPIRENAVAKLFNQWYREKNHYELGPYPKFNTGTSEIGHYTQIMSERSKECGFGLAWDNKLNKIWLVANYSPAGNVRGKYPWTAKPISTQ